MIPLCTCGHRFEQHRDIMEKEPEACRDCDCECYEESDTVLVTANDASAESKSILGSTDNAQ